MASILTLDASGLSSLRLTTVFRMLQHLQFILRQELWFIQEILRWITHLYLEIQLIYRDLARLVRRVCLHSYVTVQTLRGLASHSLRNQ